MTTSDDTDPSCDSRTESEMRLEAVRDHPAGRLRLLEHIYRAAPFDQRALAPFRRAAMSFMRWQVRRGLLAPAAAVHPGSPWWRAVNDRLLLDQFDALIDDPGRTSERHVSTVDSWTQFRRDRSAQSWYRAHNASIVAGYVAHRDQARLENEAERFFLNVVLLRVLYAHALAAAPRLALGRLAPLGPVLGDPRLGAVGAYLSVGGMLPDVYPASEPVDRYIAEENGLGRLLDYGVIRQRVPALYEWSARELDQPALASMICDGAPIYEWPYEQRWVWSPQRPASWPMRLLERVTAPQPSFCHREPA